MEWQSNCVAIGVQKKGGASDRERDLTTPSSDSAWKSLRGAERREWWLWLAAIMVTLLLTVGVVSFIVPELAERHGQLSWLGFPPAVRGLVAVVLLFDLYTIYQQWQIHRIRRKLFKREELFRLISDNAMDMIAVVDMEGKRIFNSLSYQRVLGYSPEELRGSSSLEEIHPDDRERVKSAAAESRATGLGQTLEYRIRHKNGTWRVLESTASVIRDAKGAPEKLIIVNRDITERKSAQEALRLADADFKSVVEDAPYGIYRANGEGQLFRVNPALQKMLGYENFSELLKANLELDVFELPGEFRTLTDLFDRGEDFKEAEAEWKRRMARRSRCAAAAGASIIRMARTPILKCLWKISRTSGFWSGSCAWRERWRRWGGCREGSRTTSTICWE